jgi:hypothetical protein
VHLQPAQPAVVVNKSQLPEFVHEEIHAASGGPYQLCQSLLRYFAIYGPDGVVKSVVIKNATDEPEDRTDEDQSMARKLKDKK